MMSCASRQILRRIYGCKGAVGRFTGWPGTGGWDIAKIAISRRAPGVTEFTERLE